MSTGLIAHRGSVLWIAAMIHRLSGLGLAIFLPFHFLALGLAIDSEGATHAVWGEGRDYKSPGSIWYTRGR